MDIKTFRYTVTDSTNERARQYIRSHGELPALFVAEGQSAGRGRRGRSFDSARGAGLYMTLAFSPDRGDAVLITVRAAVALAVALKTTSGLDAEIKWVNDITVGGRKLAGILAEGEVSPEGNISHCVLGVGVNLYEREFPEDISGIVTTLERETGKRIDPDELAQAFVEEFFRMRSDGEAIAYYRLRSSVIGKTVRVRRISGECFFADVMGITDGGALLVKKQDGSSEELISAEVSIAEERST